MHRPVAWTALALMAGGVIGLVWGTGAGSVAVARAGAAGVLAGSLLVAGQYARMYAVTTRPSASSLMAE